MRLQRQIALSILPLVLVACSGGGGSGSNSTQVKGVLIAPESVADTLARASLPVQAGRALRMSNPDCPNVPDGYQPLAGATITFIDTADAAIGDAFVSDDCGQFSQPELAGAVGLRALADGFRPIVADVSLFTTAQDNPALASTIEESAEYRIGALQSLDENRLAFTVTDTKSNQAVLGIPASAFKVKLDGGDAPVVSVNLAASTADKASTVMVMDASGSMTTRAYTDPDTGTHFNRYQLANRAAHTFLDQKGADDEIAMMIFSKDRFFMNQETIDRELPLVDVDNNPVVYQYSDDGYLTDARRMRFPVDAYNRQSDLYNGGDDSRHPDTPTGVRVDGRYPFAGSTALFDAIGESIKSLDDRNAVRPIVVAMTDGANNASSRSEDDVINEAIAASVPVYTIGFGGSTREETLTRIATETGGSYFSVESLDISRAYQSIQTGIVYQYIATLPQGGVADAFTIGVSLDYNQLQTEREITTSR